MNYIFGNSTLLYSRTSRSGGGGNASSGQGSGGPKHKLWAKKDSAEVFSGHSEPSRWQQVLAALARWPRFFDCVSVATSSTQVTLSFFLKWVSEDLDRGRVNRCYEGGGLEPGHSSLMQLARFSAVSCLGVVVGGG